MQQNTNFNIIQYSFGFVDKTIVDKVLSIQQFHLMANDVSFYCTFEHSFYVNVISFYDCSFNILYNGYFEKNKNRKEFWDAQRSNDTNWLTFLPK